MSNKDNSWANGVLQTPKDKLLPLGLSIFDNQESLYKSSIQLSESSLNGTATSLAILSIEEAVKANCVLLESQGNNYRNSTKFFSKILKSHSTKHEVACFLYSMLKAYSAVFPQYFSLLDSNSNNLKDNSASFESTLMNLSFEKDELEKWLETADYKKNRGFYAGYSDGVVLSPQDLLLSDLENAQNLAHFFVGLNKGFIKSIEEKDTGYLNIFDSILPQFDDYIEKIRIIESDTKKSLKEIDERYSSYKVKKK